MEENVNVIVSIPDADEATLLLGFSSLFTTFVVIDDDEDDVVAMENGGGIVRVLHDGTLGTENEAGSVF